MIAKKTSKTKVIKKQKSITPQVLGPKDKTPAPFVMDGTRHPEISQMQNVYYSHEIIKKARKAFDLQRLKSEKKKDEIV